MNESIIAVGMAKLADVDADVAAALRRYGVPAPRIRAHGVETFVSIIVSQQLSAEVSGVIMGRVKNLCPGLSARALLRVDDQALRQAGLSMRKVEYVKGLAQAVDTGQFDLEALPDMGDEEVIDAITRLRGLGRWSAEIYLMFALGRRDVFPGDDLALQVALGRLKNLPEKPGQRLARELVAAWSPWRSVGALFLWHYYRGAPAGE